MTVEVQRVIPAASEPTRRHAEGAIDPETEKTFSQLVSASRELKNLCAFIAATIDDSTAVTRIDRRLDGVLVVEIVCHTPNMDYTSYRRLSAEAADRTPTREININGNSVEIDGNKMFLDNPPHGPTADIISDYVALLNKTLNDLLEYLEPEALEVFKKMEEPELQAMLGIYAVSCVN